MRRNCSGGNRAVTEGHADPSCPLCRSRCGSCLEHRSPHWRGWKHGSRCWCRPIPWHHCWICRCTRQAPSRSCWSSWSTHSCCSWSTHSCCGSRGGFWSRWATCTDFHCRSCWNCWSCRSCTRSLFRPCTDCLFQRTHCRGHLLDGGYSARVLCTNFVLTLEEA